jgi:hypothetical protein
MTDLPQRMVEAAARAMWRHRSQAYMEAIDDLEWADRVWPLLPLDTHQRYEGFARASLRAALALAEAAVRDAMQAPLPAGKHTTTGGVVFVPLLAWAAVDAALAQEAGDAT